MKLPKLLVALSVIPLGLVGCSSDSTPSGTSAETVAPSDAAAATPDASTASAESSPAQSGGVRLVSADEAQTLANDSGVSIIDIRTPEEFAQGHIAGATELDFYAADFRDQLDGLDRNGRYLIYCHSGNRSGQARAMMTELGFADVADLDGGITAWDAAGKPITQ